MKGTIGRALNCRWGLWGVLRLLPCYCGVCYDHYSFTVHCQCRAPAAPLPKLLYYRSHIHRNFTLTGNGIHLKLIHRTQQEFLLKTKYKRGLFMSLNITKTIKLHKKHKKVKLASALSLPLLTRDTKLRTKNSRQRGLRTGCTSLYPLHTV